MLRGRRMVYIRGRYIDAPEGWFFPVVPGLMKFGEVVWLRVVLYRAPGSGAVFAWMAGCAACFYLLNIDFVDFAVKMEI